MAPKNGIFTQLGLVSPDGTRAGAGFAALAAGQGADLLVDEQGRPWVRVDTSIPFPGFATRVQFAAEELEDVDSIVGAGTGMLVQCTGYNDPTGVTAYAQIYDTAAEPAPADLPIQSMPLAPGASFGWSPGGWEFANGLWFALSTTPVGYTSAGETLWVNALLWVP